MTNGNNGKNGHSNGRHESKDFVTLVMDTSKAAQRSKKILDTYDVNYTVIEFDHSRPEGYSDNPRPPHMLTPRGDRCSLETITEYAETYGRKPGRK